VGPRAGLDAEARRKILHVYLLWKYSCLVRIKFMTESVNTLNDFNKPHIEAVKTETVKYCHFPCLRNSMLPLFVPRLAGQHMCIFVTVNEARRYLATCISKVAFWVAAEENSLDDRDFLLILYSYLPLTRAKFSLFLCSVQVFLSCLASSFRGCY
jgi:hypothetical protein